MRLFDVHCHLQDDLLLPHLDAVMNRATGAGVGGLMCCGTEEADWDLLPDITRRFPGVRLSFGIHPWSVGERTSRWLDQLKDRLATYPASVGEIGLDHTLPSSTFADQESVFLAQIHLANELERPVSLHCRQAFGRLMDLLDTEGWPARGFVLHSYSGPSELVQPLAGRGAYFSFSGAITFDRNRKGREALVAVPADRLLLETDAPFLPPAGLALPENGNKPVNEPAFLVQALEVAARLRGTDQKLLAEQTWRNAMALFKPS